MRSWASFWEHKGAGLDFGRPSQWWWWWLYFGGRLQAYLHRLMISFFGKYPSNFHLPVWFFPPPSFSALYLSGTERDGTRKALFKLWANSAAGPWILGCSPPCLPFPCLRMVSQNALVLYWQQAVLIRCWPMPPVKWTQFHLSLQDPQYALSAFA